MLHSILHITGLEQKLEALRDRIEGEAQSLMQHGRAVAVQMAIVRRWPPARRSSG